MTIRDELQAAITAALIDCPGVPWRFDRCAVFAADILHGVLGYDPGAPWRGRYTTERGMRRVMGKRGLAGMVARAARRHGWRRITPAQAQAGDVGLIDTPRGVAVALCHGGMFVGPVDRGFAAHGASRVLRAWSVV